MILLLLGQCSQKQGRNDEAKEYLEKSLILTKKQFGPKHYNVAKVFYYLACATKNVGEVGNLLKQAVIILRKYPNGFLLIQVLQLLVDTCVKISDDWSIYKSNPELLQPIKDSNRVDSIMMLYKIALAYWSEREVIKCKETLCQALKVFVLYYGRNHPDITLITGLLAKTYIELGLQQKAAEMLEWTLRIDQRYLSDKTKRIGLLLCDLIEVYLNAGEEEKAKKLFLRLIEGLDREKQKELLDFLWSKIGKLDQDSQLLWEKLQEKMALTSL
jgi:tetratricopeptide (TPR) repeat protein